MKFCQKPRYSSSKVNLNFSIFAGLLRNRIFANGGHYVGDTVLTRSSLTIEKEFSLFKWYDLKVKETGSTLSIREKRRMSGPREDLNITGKRRRDKEITLRTRRKPEGRTVLVLLYMCSSWIQMDGGWRLYVEIAGSQQRIGYEQARTYCILLLSSCASCYR